MAFPIVLALAAAQAAAQAAKAQKQKKEAKKAERYMPAALSESTNLARAQAGATRAPGQAIAEEGIRQATADAFSNVKRGTRSSGDLLNTAARLQLGQNRATQQLAGQTQAFRQGAMDRYRGALSEQANVQMGNRRYAEALRGAAGQNEFNAVQSVLGGVALQYGGANTGRVPGTTGSAKNAGTKPLFSSTLPQNTQTTPLSQGPFGYRANRNMFSNSRFNPNAFSANYNYR